MKVGMNMTSGNSTHRLVPFSNKNLQTAEVTEAGAIAAPYLDQVTYRETIAEQALKIPVHLSV
jgi:hypothetical protein